MSNVRRHVDGGRHRVDGREPCPQVGLRTAVLAPNDGGDPLAHRGQGGAVLAQVTVGVGMGVDEPGSQNQPPGVHHLLPRHRFKGTSLDYGVPLDTHTSLAPRRPGAVNQYRVRDEG
jgi:hypothetical protein